MYTGSSVFSIFIFQHIYEYIWDRVLPEDNASIRMYEYEIGHKNTGPTPYI